MVEKHRDQAVCRGGVSFLSPYGFGMASAHGQANLRGYRENAINVVRRKRSCGAHHESFAGVQAKLTVTDLQQTRSRESPNRRTIKVTAAARKRTARVSAEKRQSSIGSTLASHPPRSPPGLSNARI